MLNKKERALKTVSWTVYEAQVQRTHELDKELLKVRSELELLKETNSDIVKLEAENHKLRNDYNKLARYVGAPTI